MVTRIKATCALVLLALVLAACSLGGQPDSPPEPQQAPPESEADVPTPEPAPTETAVPATEAPAEPTATVSLLDDEIPKGSSALKASDPSQVSLTGDKPRLVEFFAFW